MPRIDKILTLEITPQQFLESCSASELKEIDLLIQSNWFVTKMNELELPEHSETEE